MSNALFVSPAREKEAKRKRKNGNGSHDGHNRPKIFFARRFPKLHFMCVTLTIKAPMAKTIADHLPLFQRLTAVVENPWPNFARIFAAYFEEFAPLAGCRRES